MMNNQRMNKIADCSFIISREETMSQVRPEERIALERLRSRIYDEVELPRGDVIMKEVLEVAAPRLIRWERIEVASVPRTDGIFVV